MSVLSSSLSFGQKKYEMVIEKTDGTESVFNTEDVARTYFRERGHSDTSCPDSNHPHLINLGLPSGTKWACCNVGATKPEAYGGYYAWGETEEKSYYDYSTYKWCNGSYFTQTKYCDSSFYGTVDNKTILDPEDDVAHVKWGGNWKIPTREQIRELLNNCNYEWTTVNGVKGGKFTSNINSKSIFLPAAGNRWIGDLKYAGEHGYCWSSERGGTSGEACALGFDSVEAKHLAHCDRAEGFPARPVQK